MRTTCTATVLLLLMWTSFLPFSGANWMYLGMVGVSVTVTPEMASEQVSICSSVPGLVTQQQKVCQAHPAVIRAVSSGARRGIQECQSQFRHDRWNCTVEGGDSVFGYTLQRAVRPLLSTPLLALEPCMP